VHVAWYTGAEGKPGVFHAVSADGGVTFGEAQPLLAGDWVPISRVHLAPAGNRVLGVWDDVRTDPAMPRVGWITPEGVAADTLATGGTFPVVAADGTEAIVAWLDGNRILVRTARLSDAETPRVAKAGSNR
jgi:hypothetical protein